MQLTAEQKRAYHTDGICRVIEIKEHLIATDNRQAILKHCPFDKLGNSENYPGEVFADAYVKAIECGDLDPIVFDEEYDDMVKRKEHEAIVRRLKGDSVVRNGNKPFKREKDAREFQQKYSLTNTHDVKATTGGFELCQKSLAEQQAIIDRANGLKTYEELRSQAFQELGLSEAENEDGELDATDEQWAVIDARVNELQKIQRSI